MNTAILAYTALTAARTVALPSAAEQPIGRTIVIKDESGAAGTYNITINASAQPTIDGASSIVISNNYGQVRLYHQR